MEKTKENTKRPKMKFLESAFNDIVTTIGHRPAESGGLLFGKEDDYVVRKFVFDKYAKVTGSSYTFNTEYLNPEIKRLWKDEGLSCIGFIHSHPNGYGRLSLPDKEYFKSMFECMPRKYYLTPIVFTAPDGGFKINAHILTNGKSETQLADIEILPDDYFETIVETEFKPEINNTTARNHSIILQDALSKLNRFEKSEMIIWKIWKLIMAFGLGWFILKASYLLTNLLN